MIESAERERGKERERMKEKGSRDGKPAIQ